MSHHSSSGSIEGLPKQFVTSLRILFDILDEDRTGYVRLCDIESRWHEEGVRGLPSGVIETLRKVAPQNGKLSFENFVTGLKLSLLKSPPNIQSGNENRSVRIGYEKQVPGPEKNVNRTDSTQYRTEHKLENQQNRQIGRRAQQTMKMGRSTASNTVAVRPNNALAVPSQNVELRNQIYQQNREHQQVSSQLRHRAPDLAYHNAERVSTNNQMNDRFSGENDRNRRDVQMHQPRPKSEEIHRVHVPSQSQRPPPRPEHPPPYHHTRSPESVPPVIPPRDRNRRIMQELKAWHREQKNEGSRFHVSNSDSKLTEQNHMSSNAIYVNIDQIRQHAASIKQAPTTGNPPKTGVRRQNSRRHTLTSGVDYNTIRRMKQLEQEKDILLQGLETAEHLRDWYHRQIAVVAEKQNYIEKTSCSEATLEANQERMDFQRARITELNQHLKMVMESTDKKFPAHMNLAIRNDIFTVENSVQRLKNQNKLLTKEVGEKGEKITQLEKEKASLIRELFEARTKHKSNYDDTTFM